MNTHNRGRRFPPTTRTREEIERLLGACGPGWLGARNRALLIVLYRAGLRCNEATTLELLDVRLQVGCAVIRVSHPKGEGKGAPHREVGLDARSSSVLAEWLQARGNAPGAVFVTSRGSRVPNANVRRMLQRLARAAGVSGRVYPHGMRHTFARELYDERVGLRETQLALGHRNLAITGTYLQHIGATEVVAVTTGRHW